MMGKDFICDGGFMQPVDGKVFINKGDGSYKPPWIINKYATTF